MANYYNNGGNIVDQNGNPVTGALPAGSSYFNTAPPTAASTPTPSTQPDPITASNVRRYTGDAPTEGTYATEAAKAFGSGGIFDVSMPDEAAMRAEAQRRVAAQIDSIRNTYAGILSEAQRQGTDRMGRTRATSARSGTLGSDFGNAALDETAKANAAQLDAIAAERDAKINAILTAADDRASQDIANKRNLALKSAEDRLSYLKNVADTSRGDLTTYFKSGGTLDSLSDTQYKQFLDETGWSPEQAKAQEVLNKPQETVLTSFTQGNKYFVVTQDPITRQRKTESIDLGFTVPLEYDTQKLDDGTLVFYPKKWDPTKPLKDQILTYGTQSQAYKLDIQQKQASLAKTYAEIEKLKQDGTEDKTVVDDLKGAAAAVSAGADPQKVRQRFIETHPKKSTLFDQYMGNSTLLLLSSGASQ